MGAFWWVSEGDILAIRTPSSFDTLRVKQYITDLTEKVDNGLEIQDGLSRRVTDGEFLQEKLQSTIESSLQTQADIEDTISTSILTQNGIKTEVATLHNKVEALEGAVLDAVYLLSSRANPRIGEFQIYNGGTETIIWADVDSIKFDGTDHINNPHTFDSVKLEDLVRLSAPGGSAVYKIASNRTVEDNGFGGNLYGFDVEIVSESGTAASSLQYDFEITPAFDASAYVTKTYVDAQDALKLDLTGGNLTGTLRLNSEINNDDSLRFYMRDKDGNDNLTLYPSGLVVSKNVFRVTKDSGDCFQVKDADAAIVKWKVDADGVNTVPKIVLTGDDADINKRVIDVKQGEAGRLAYDSLTKMSWGASNVWIGSTTTTGEDDHSVDLNLQGNSITDVGSFTLNHTGQSNGNKFVIKGETDDGADTDLFYSYKNDDGTIDAVNYKGRMTNEFNIVNKGYVDTEIASIDLDGSLYMPKTGDTFTGQVTFNSSSNQQVQFTKNGNNDIIYKENWIVSFQGDASPKIKLNSTVDFNDNYLANVKDAASDTDAVNKRYLKGARVTETSSGNTKKWRLLRKWWQIIL